MSLVFIASLCFCMHMCMYSCSWLCNIESLNCCTLSLLVSSLRFPNAWNLFMSFLGCSILCIVINLVVLCFICMGSSFYFDNNPEYLISETSQVLILLIRYLPEFFFVLLRHSFSPFSFIYLIDGVRFLCSLVLVIFFFCNCSDAFLFSLLFLFTTFP